MERTAQIERKTLETDVVLELSIAGSGKAKLDTGVPFLEHMLILWCRHGFFDLQVNAGSDSEMDFHHLVEDVGLCLGRALNRALGNKEGINRYGSSLVPMDDALALAVVDFSGRPYLHYEVDLPLGKVGDLDPELFREFWQAVVNEGRFNLHLKTFHGYNKHHLMEAIFKSAGRAMNEGSSFCRGITGPLSSKGCLD